MISLCTKGYERFVQAEEFLVRYTGAEANVAVSLAGFGMDTYAVSKVPKNDIGQACINYIRRFGVNTDYIARGGDRLGLLYMETGASQRPSTVIYDRLNSSIRQVRSEDFDWDKILDGKNWLHFSGTAPALGDEVVGVLKEALAAAKRKGVTVSCDCNYRSKLWSLEKAGRVMSELMPNVDVFIGGRQDARGLFGIDLPNKDDELELSAIAAQAMREKFGFKCVAMTVRDVPSASLNYLTGLICNDAGIHTSRRYELQIVDRVGGGDAFTAGLIYGILSNYEPQRTVEFAVAASCLKHSIPGDFNLVSVDEVEEVASNNGSARIRR